jgi:hypothetical protein
MMSPVIIAPRLGAVLDAMFAGAFWWRLKRWRAEQVLERSLLRHGERSFEARRATEAVRELDFAVRYWRRAPPEIRGAAQAAVDLGVPLEDVRYLMLSRDLFAKGDKSQMRRLKLLRAASVLSAWTVWGHWLFMIALTIQSSAPWYVQLSVASGMTAVYALLFRWWTLYVARGCRAARRHQATLEIILPGSQREGSSVKRIQPKR